MKKGLATFGLAMALILMVNANANAVVITFTGGTVTLNDTTTPPTTSNSVTYFDVDKYSEGGFTVDFQPPATSSFSTIIGNYYGAGNDVIHSHWLSGGLGGVTKIVFTKDDATAFDLNYFILTSNTQTGGGPASGLEDAYIHASVDGVTSSFSQKLPSEDWGFPATQIFLGPQFDGIKAFWFEALNDVDCFGMDEFYINEEAPGTVPEPASLALLSLGAIGAGGYALKKRRARS